MAYDKNTDYAALIAGTKDPVKKAEYEAARNEKIAAMNKAGTNTGGYTATYNYTQTPAAPQPNAGATAAGGGASPVSYIDANGNKKTGYISGGITYTDQSLKNQVGVGSVVTAGDGKEYIKTPTGGQLYSDYLAQNGIRKVDTMDHASGARGAGYVKDGTTYADPLLTQRIADGTVVRTDGGEYIKTDLGSMLYSDYLAKNGKAGAGADALGTLTNQLAQVNAALDQAMANNDAGYVAQLQQLKNSLQTQIDELNRSYKELNKQLYIDYMNSKRDIPQALAAQGYTGGLRESSLLGLDAGYRGNLNENELARIAGITDLQRGGEDDQLQLLIAKAQADQQAQDNYYARQMQLAQLIAAQQAADADREAEAEERLYTRELERAQLAAQYGDSSQIYKMLGIPEPAKNPYSPPPPDPDDDTDDDTDVGEPDTPKAGTIPTVTVPGMGALTYDDAEQLERQGYIRLHGIDASGNPVYIRTAKRQTENIALSR